MGKLKVKKKDRPYERRSIDLGVHNAVSLAMAEYNAKKRARIMLTENAEILKKITAVDADRELWMWGCMALVLHRKYRWTAATISKIFEEIQALHNDLYDDTLTDEELKRVIIGLCVDEIGLNMLDADNVG